MTRLLCNPDISDSWKPADEAEIRAFVRTVTWTIRDSLECASGHSYNRVAQDILLFTEGSEHVMLKDKGLSMHCFRECPLWTRRSRTHVLSWDLEQGAANRGRGMRSYPQAHPGPFMLRPPKEMRESNRAFQFSEPFFSAACGHLLGVWNSG